MFHFNVVFLEQGQSGIHLDGDVLRQPDFIVYADLFDRNARTPMDARQKQADGNGVDALDIQLRPLRVAFVDPCAEAELDRKSVV